MMRDSTRTDPDGDWQIADRLNHLRLWGGDREFELPDEPFAERVIGAGPTCAMVLDDKTQRLSREHARLVSHGVLWTIEDLGSKNGTWIDGARRQSSAITPGTEIRVGNVVLVAESPAFVALRDLLRRWIGWGHRRCVDVDQALRVVREAFSERRPLVLCGRGPLESVAERLHRETLGPRPFVACRASDELSPALERAARGTLCVSTGDKVRSVPSAIGDVLLGAPNVRLVICAPSFDVAAPLVSALQNTVRLDLPPISERRDEFPRLISEYVREYARDAEAILRAQAIVPSVDIGALAEHAYGTLAEIEDDARRLVVLRALGVRAGAKTLRISHAAFSRWAWRRRLRTRW
ncbi:MAG: FHA domain-containing protein [Deltaproteobacteria bacterium]|nr:FHA domain-containing protein [Deltaproteobacteria bacterium]